MLHFDLFVDLTDINDSLLLNSNDHIATLYIDGYSYDLYTRGEVRVEYEGVDYRLPSEFPEALKQAIRDDKLKDVAIVENNNWFEVFEVDKDCNWTGASDIVNVESHTAGQVLAVMQEYANAVAKGRCKNG